MAGIDTEIHRDLDCFIELGLGALFDELHGLLDRIKLLAVDALLGLAQTFSVHGAYSFTVRPMERAEPAIIFAA